MTVHHVTASPLVSVIVELLECGEQEVSDSLLERTRVQPQDDVSTTLEDTAQILSARLRLGRTVRTMLPHVDADLRDHASFAPEMPRLQGLSACDQPVQQV